MTRWNLGLALALGGLLAACQSADKNAAEQQKNQDLERRVAQLERKATPSPAAETTATPEPAWERQLHPAPTAPAAPRAAGCHKPQRARP
jgi:hypothetical protein